MVETLVVACLGSGALFDGKSIDQIEQEIDTDYWKSKKSDRLW